MGISPLEVSLSKEQQQLLTYSQTPGERHTYREGKAFRGHRRDSINIHAADALWEAGGRDAEEQI